MDRRIVCLYSISFLLEEICIMGWDGVGYGALRCVNLDIWLYHLSVQGVHFHSSWTGALH